MASLRCPYCLADLSSAEPAAACGRCGTPHHLACFLEHGRCTVLACGGRRVRGLEGPLAPELGALRPFFPVDPRQLPAFLAVRREALPLPRAVGAPRLRLSVPTQAQCGQLAEASLTLDLPAPLAVQGLRLEVEASATLRAGTTRLTRVAATLEGGPRRSWRERLGIARAGGAVLEPGRYRYRLAWDPALPDPRALLPRHEAIGRWHLALLRVELEPCRGPALRTRWHRLVVAHAHRACARSLAAEPQPA